MFVKRVEEEKCLFVIYFQKFPDTIENARIFYFQQNNNIFA
jgi:hypothetical protein